MNLPVFLSRLVQMLSPMVLLRSWVRFRTAPFRALSPTGLLVAIPSSFQFSRDTNHGGRLGFQKGRTVPAHGGGGGTRRWPCREAPPSLLGSSHGLCAARAVVGLRPG